MIDQDEKNTQSFTVSLDRGAWIRALEAKTIITQPEGSSGVHESCTRAFGLVCLVEEWLRDEIPGPAVLKLMTEFARVAEEYDRLRRIIDHARKTNNDLQTRADKLQTENNVIRAVAQLGEVQSGPAEAPHA